MSTTDLLNLSVLNLMTNKMTDLKNSQSIE